MSDFIQQVASDTVLHIDRRIHTNPDLKGIRPTCKGSRAMYQDFLREAERSIRRRLKRQQAAARAEVQQEPQPTLFDAWEGNE